MSKVLLINPARRKRRATKKKPIARRKRRTTMASTTRTTRVTKRRRNPARRSVRGFGGIVQNTLIPSATAAAGALSLDVAWGMLPIPENLKVGPIRHVAKAAGAIGIGMLAKMFASNATANLVTAGAMTVVMHSAGKEMLGRVAPNLTLGEYEDYETLAYAGAGGYSGNIYGDEMGEYMGEYMGEDDQLSLYQPNDISEMGEYEDDVDIEI